MTNRNNWMRSGGLGGQNIFRKTGFCAFRLQKSCYRFKSSLLPRCGFFALSGLFNSRLKPLAERLNTKQTAISALQIPLLQHRDHQSS